MIQKIKDYFNTPSESRDEKVELPQQEKEVKYKEVLYNYYFYKATIKIILKDTKAVLMEEYCNQLGYPDDVENVKESLFSSYLNLARIYNDLFKIQNTYHHINNIYTIEVVDVKLNKTVTKVHKVQV